MLIFLKIDTNSGSWNLNNLHFHFLTNFLLIYGMKNDTMASIIIIKLPGRVKKSIHSPFIKESRRFSSIIFPKINPKTTGAVGKSPLFNIQPSIPKAMHTPTSNTEF